MNFIEKLKLYLEDMDTKTLVRNLSIVLLAGAIILISSSIFLKKDGKDDLPSMDVSTKEKSKIEIENYAEALEKKLEYILSHISGVGDVNVMITLEETTEKIPAINTTQNQENTKEEDSQGGIREVNREDSTSQVITESGEGNLVILKEKKPKVRGVIVVAEGAGNLQIEEKLYNAVKTVLDIPGNKVEIYSSN